MSASPAVFGRAVVFGDDVSTDLLAPGRYLKLPARVLASHCLEAIDPGFASRVMPDDVLVAGRNFGLGSSREQAAISLKLLGIGAVLALSFARIFFRNAVNVGLPVLAFEQSGEIAGGDLLRVDPGAGQVDNITSGKTWRVEPLPIHLLAIIRDGGLIPHLKLRLAAEQPASGIQPNKARG